MSDKAEKLKAELAELSDEDRAELLDYFAGLDDGEQGLTREEWEAAWAEECNRRLADLEAGRTTLISGDEVMRELREKYG